MQNVVYSTPTPDSGITYYQYSSLRSYKLKNAGTGKNLANQDMAGVPGAQWLDSVQLDSVQEEGRRVCGGQIL